MIILAFLGNPGKKYYRTRHNAGFIVGEKIASSYGISINKKNFSAETGSGSLPGGDVLFIFPQTFMNLSGQSVSRAMNFYNTKHDELIVIHDELELQFGDVRYKFGGGHKGHNGLRSIIAETGSADFHRIRFGIGRPDNPQMDVADYVLSSFSHEEYEKIDGLVPAVNKIIQSIIEKK